MLTLPEYIPRLHYSSNMIPLYFLTFNWAKQGSKGLDKASAEIISKSFPSQKSALYAFGVQELCSIQSGCFSGVVQDYLKTFGRQLCELLQEKYSSEFRTVAISSAGAIGLVVISPFHSEISDVQTAHASCGYLYTSLKGGCGVRLRYKRSEFTVGCGHLSAHEGVTHATRRQADFESVLRGLQFDDGWGMLKPGAHTFVMGDFNMRATDNVTVYDAAVDELAVARARGGLLALFDEATISFKPTYKYYLGVNEYNEKRTPSWCDRIIYQKYQDPVDIEAYDALDQIKVSDHKPVYLSIQVPESAPTEVVSLEGVLKLTHLFMRPTIQDSLIRRVTSVNDFTFGWSLFLTCTYYGNALLAGSVFCLIWWWYK